MMLYCSDTKEMSRLTMSGPNGCRAAKKQGEEGASKWHGYSRMEPVKTAKEWKELKPANNERKKAEDGSAR